ncbi:MAG: hypothetical protein HGB36_11430 [Chlorobiaceae bacterium]|nr:hypothetical protein [Chlorobiaceae bacterium]
MVGEAGGHIISGSENRINGRYFMIKGAGMNRLLHYVFEIDTDLPT